MSMINTSVEWSWEEGGAGAHGEWGWGSEGRDSRRPYWGDFGGVCWGSLLGFFPGWCSGGSDAHCPAGRRVSRGGRPEVARLGLEEEEEEELEEQEEVGYVSLDLASPGRSKASGHFLSSPAGAAQAGLASLGAAAC